MPFEGEKFLHRKDSGLHVSPPVKHEQERRELAGEPVSEKPLQKIADWMRVLERTHGHEDPRVLERIKAFYHKNYVISPSDVPEAVFLLEQSIAREMGHGTVEITEEFKDRKREEIVSGQKNSLDKWVNYLTSADATYPVWAKYWAFTSMLKMGKFEKYEDEQGQEQARFSKRTKDTVAPFPPLNPRALAMAVGAMQQRLEQQEFPSAQRTPVANISAKLKDEQFQKLLSGESFSKLYTQFLIELPEYSSEGLEEIKGEWRTFPRNSSPESLVKSLEGYPLEWCTAQIEVARTQLQGGDFHVYYSINSDGKPVVPRVAIRMEEMRIAEVRGIAPNQSTDPYITPVVEKKMVEFGSEGEVYVKRASDMKFLTAIEKKTQNNIPLTKEDLTFLYEINGSIEGFGYEKDPRVKELRDQRNLEKDMLVILECTKEQIAHTASHINENTEAYVGKLTPGIFQKIQQYNIEHIYTSFPEEKIQQYHIEIGGKTKEEYSQALKDEGAYVTDVVRDLMKSKDFTISQTKEVQDLVQLTVADLGLSEGAMIEQIYKRAKTLGLELCPAEIGPALRLVYTGSDLIFIGMKPISDRDGNPRVFNLNRDADDLGLDADSADPTDRWYSGFPFVFRSRKLET